MLKKSFMFHCELKSNLSFLPNKHVNNFQFFYVKAHKSLYKNEKIKTEGIEANILSDKIMFYLFLLEIRLA